jgi:hypothetical protein
MKGPGSEKLPPASKQGAARLAHDYSPALEARQFSPRAWAQGA